MLSRSEVRVCSNVASRKGKYGFGQKLEEQKGRWGSFTRTSDQRSQIPKRFKNLIHSKTDGEQNTQKTHWKFNQEAGIKATSLRKTRKRLEFNAGGG